MMVCGCQHMAPAVMLGNTSDCHVMRCSTRCWGHTAGQAAHSPYLLLNRICTHSRRVLMSSVSFMKASHFSIKTQEVQVRASESRDPMARLPATPGTLPAGAVPHRQPSALGFLSPPEASPSPSTHFYLGAGHPTSSRKQLYTDPGALMSPPAPPSGLCPPHGQWISCRVSVRPGPPLPQTGSRLGEYSP